ncbi:MAG: nucleotidyltransferase family protein [bacterium]|nr:nucleotidyltransferase family protein [bacterium]
MEMDAFLQKNRDTIIEIATKHGVQSIRVFGSHAKGISRQENDLDLLVTPEPGRTSLDLTAIKQNLENALECRVEVVTETSLNPYIRARILNEAIAL